MQGTRSPSRPRAASRSCPAATVAEIGEEAGLSTTDADELATIYTEAQLSSLRVAFFGLIVISVASLLFSRGIPPTVPARTPKAARAG